MKSINICWPDDLGGINNLRAGDFVLFSGFVYSARDQAHQRLCSSLKNKNKLPIDLKNQIIYYVGPTPAKQNQVIGSCGPTTSARMDAFTPQLLEYGIRAMIGKGKRDRGVAASIKKHKAVYFVTIGGAGAYLSTKVVSSRVIAYEDLGPEAIFELELKEFPLFVAIDSRGNSI